MNKINLSSSPAIFCRAHPGGSSGDPCYIMGGITLPVEIKALNRDAIRPIIISDLNDKI
jgi:hypothetical protein